MPNNNQVNPSDQDNKSQATSKQNATQGVPLSNKQKQQAQAIEQQIQGFEVKLGNSSNSELAQISTKFETVERAMLLEKIDNELHIIKDTIVQPGDGESTADAGVEASVAVAASTASI